MNLSLREKLLVFGSLLLIVFYLYYNLALNPILKSIDNNRADIIKTKTLIAQKRISNYPGSSPKNIWESLLPKENQMTYIINFINAKIKGHHMKLLSLTQSTAERKIFLDLGLQGSYENILGFLNSFEDANSFLYIDTADISSQRKGIALTLKIICAYK